MSRKSSRKLLEQSCNWIRGHWDAKNLDVPKEFILKWIYEPDDEELKPSGFYLSVFSFGYFQHQLVSKNIPLGEKLGIPSKRLFEHFQMWQMKLALAEINRVTDVRVVPMPLFDFPDGEQVEYCRVAWEKPETVE